MDLSTEALAESALVAAYIAAPFLLLAVLAAIGDRAADKRWSRRHEPVVTPHDFDDWRDPIRDFRAEQYIRAIRRRFAVASVCGADPEKTEAAAVGRPASTTTHGGMPHDSHRK